MTSITINDNIWATALGDVADAENLLRYKMPGYQFSPAGKRGWNGWISLSKFTEGGKGEIGITFPAGLVQYVLSQPWAKGWTVIDERVKPNEFLNLNLFSKVELGQLEPHQLEAVDAAIKAERGIVQYPTGTGKGRIIGEIVRRLGLRCLVIVDKLDLVKSVGDEIEMCIGTKVGRIGGGQRHSSSNCVIGTYQSLVKYNESWHAGWQVVIIDEGHHAEAKSYEQLLSSLKNAYYRIALSATPFRSWAGKAHDPTFLKVQAYTGPPVATMSLSEGVDTGRIVPVNVFIVGGLPPKVEKPLNYREDYDENIVRNHLRNSAIAQAARALRLSGPTVVLVQRIEQGASLAIAIDCPFISGKGVLVYHSKWQRADLERSTYYEEFKRGNIDCLVISSIANEGLDLPNIDHLLLAGDNNADHILIQQLGRGMRASTGKVELTAMEFPVMSKYLGAHARRRRRLYEREPAYTVLDMDMADLGFIEGIVG